MLKGVLLPQAGPWAGPFFSAHTIVTHTQPAQEEERHGENCRRNERRRR
jgi:hypothetical protein